VTNEQIAGLNHGDEVYVFDQGKDRYIKRTVDVDKNGLRYVWGDPRGYFKTRDSIPLTSVTNAVTADELPAAKKRHAERRKAEKAAESARATRQAEAIALAGELHALGVSTRRYGKHERPTVDYHGIMLADLTVEQARALRDALKGGTT